jgi:hypothetical protein
MDAVRSELVSELGINLIPTLGGIDLDAVLFFFEAFNDRDGLVLKG